MIGQDTRDTIYKHLNKMLGSELAKDIENSIYSFSKEYAETNETPFLEESIYSSKSESLLKVIGNNLQFIIQSIKNNTIDPKMIGFMRISDLDLKQYSDIIKKKEMDVQLMNPVGTTAFECKKCKKRNTTVVEKQVRSGDEPATQFITCLECGYVFTKG
jgi:DNA-directed RNA polymerase subunit M/transcription elongation factor TFIIS